jgi:hypothetical protein
LKKTAYVVVAAARSRKSGYAPVGDDKGRDGASGESSC